MYVERERERERKGRSNERTYLNGQNLGKKEHDYFLFYRWLCSSVE